MKGNHSLILDDHYPRSGHRLGHFSRLGERLNGSCHDWHLDPFLLSWQRFLPRPAISELAADPGSVAGQYPRGSIPRKLIRGAVLEENST
jgi:hypothetical protein